MSFKMRCHYCTGEGCVACTPAYPGQLVKVDDAKTVADMVREDIKKNVTDVLSTDPKLVAKGNPKAALGMAKIPLALVPPVAIAHCADAMRDGAVKYGAWNFREVEISASVYVNACKRHLDLWFAGQNKASDSGVHHLGHAMACLALIMDSELYGNLDDDRPPNNLDTDALENLFKSLEK